MRRSRLSCPPASADYARALDCLASAVWYEAGDDRGGQQAVAQVVLNRLRHPAYPHTVCGVVYQGAQRSTGCQFTFTCDGALARRPSVAGWQRARETARAFLAGTTDPRVGMATHYHTDWVHPYWSASLDKIAKVGTHLFFRWHGGWGRRAAFASGYAGGEQREPRLAMLSPAHAGGAIRRASPMRSTIRRGLPPRVRPAAGWWTGAVAITSSSSMPRAMATRWRCRGWDSVAGQAIARWSAGTGGRRASARPTTRSPARSPFCT
ncbi:cell wall hydrolase [Novosphingobium colocasiae]